MAIARAWIITAAVVAMAQVANAAHRHTERWYQEQWCGARGGQMEVILQDGTRVDCLTETHAIEFDFSGKWAESIGQALNYSRMTGRRPGVVLIIEAPGDDVKTNRVREIFRHYGIHADVWEVR
jgi:hypothetical protein